jgi:flagellin-like hook-associated protein FlgL
MIINSNISSLNTQRKLAGTNVGLTTTMERLSSALSSWRPCYSSAIHGWQ